jgi:Tfp pilus assembly protein PilN
MNRINLLPPEARVKASRERDLLYAILMLVAVVVALGLVYVWQNRQVSSKEDTLAQVNAQVAVEQARAARLAPFAALQTAKTAMTQTAQSIYNARVSWSTILEEISLVIPANVRVKTLTCAVPPGMLPGAVAGAPGTTVAATTPDVSIAGETQSHKDVAEFMTRLGLIPQLKDITLASSTVVPAPTDASGVPAAPTIEFTVTASLRPYQTPPPATTLQAP